MSESESSSSVSIGGSSESESELDEESGLLSLSLLLRFADLRGVICAATAGLTAQPGMGRVRAGRLSAVGELARRLASETLDPGVSVTCSDVVFAHFAPLLADEKRETFQASLTYGGNRGRNSTLDGRQVIFAIQPVECETDLDRCVAPALRSMRG